MTLRPRVLALATASVGGAITAAVVLVPAARFAYRAPATHLALESVAGVIGLVAAYLLAGRFRRSRLAGDLVLAWALALLSAANLFFATLPATFDGGDGRLDVWAALSVRLAGAVAFAAAPFLAGRRLERARRAGWGAVVAAALVVACAAGASLALGSALPSPIGPDVSPEQSGRPLIVGHPAVVSVQLVSLVLFAVATFGFARTAERTRDELYTWLAVGAALAAVSRLNYFLFPSLYTEWVYTGDAFRLAFYVVLLAGAAREIRRYWERETEAAVLEERRRMARDLHDGLAQELAFIAGQSARLARQDPSAPGLVHLRAAADRALGEARRAIAALTRPLDEPVDVVLAEVAEEIAGRSGLRLEFTSSVERDVTPAAREELVRVLREAITNAARHGRARTVRVTLANGDGLNLSIADDGIGFDPERPGGVDERGGFGLTSIRERVGALGGDVRIVSHPGRGTTVEVTVP